jgi:hypothetical protein
MPYKTYKEFYWKRAIWSLGLPWGFLMGVFTAILDNKEVLAYFTSGEVIFRILFFMAGGCFWAIGGGRRYWRIMKKAEEQKN